MNVSLLLRTEELLVLMEATRQERREWMMAKAPTITEIIQKIHGSLILQNRYVHVQVCNMLTHSVGAYSVGAFDISQSKVRDIAVWWNDAFRKIFNLLISFHLLDSFSISVVYIRLQALL